MLQSERFDYFVYCKGSLELFLFAVQELAIGAFAALVVTPVGAVMVGLDVMFHFHGAATKISFPKPDPDAMFPVRLPLCDSLICVRMKLRVAPPSATVLVLAQARGACCAANDLKPSFEKGRHAAFPAAIRGTKRDPSDLDPE